MFMKLGDPSALRQRMVFAALAVLVGVGLAAMVLLCAGGAQTLLGILQLAGQPDALSKALQTHPAGLQTMGKEFLQSQGYASSGLGLLLFHSGLWLVPVLSVCLCAAIGGFAWWQRRKLLARQQTLESALIAWLQGAEFSPPDFCPDSLREAVTAHTARQAGDLQAARQQAADADRFAQNIYHQIKTPLAAAELLLEQLAGQASGGSAEQAGQCRLELEKISALTRTLLQTGKFEAGGGSLHWQPEDLALLAEDTIADLQPLWQARQLQIRLDAPDSDPVRTTLCDAFWLGEALGNLLKNCIEQTSPGGTIFCRIEYSPAQTRMIIRDPGSFLPENTDIFARYATTRTGGVGIGLHLARQIALAHFGTLTACNRADGCEFCLTLPVLQGAAPYRQPDCSSVTEL